MQYYLNIANVGKSTTTDFLNLFVHYPNCSGRSMFIGKQCKLRKYREIGSDEIRNRQTVPLETHFSPSNLPSIAFLSFRPLFTYGRRLTPCGVAIN